MAAVNQANVSMISQNLVRIKKERERVVINANGKYGIGVNAFVSIMRSKRTQCNARIMNPIVEVAISLLQRGFKANLKVQFVDGSSHPNATRNGLTIERYTEIVSNQ
uniref:uncharacterized protein LOC117610878 n=1 Tax=Osmia lignaria TaxID=473952 RepID=UPI0014784694|nr:uncharacterized protein LOC117610878 [Osmia lignaria]XP_034194770.1 uncharacterized protein LOC117610996 [Osmia lignaria]XP_034195059.1 uncharacterized protein LOC117611233 [Osmia lignaria]XP_034195184.1 uncharacterized protein LOC117611358 [Osmia lignaria]XP_034195204.1 uncharacterized protein LOC117611379 [Osmia lignaria]XP_034195298.1 uncharacterized protein LOC117611456 [Osmia lignaria]